MSTLRKVKAFATPILGATVYRDAEWDEYRVKFFRDGVYQSKADYHTDDKEDALSTARSFISK